MISRTEYIKSKEFSIAYRQRSDWWMCVAGDDDRKYDKCVAVVREYENQIKWWQFFKKIDKMYIPRFKSGNKTYRFFVTTQSIAFFLFPISIISIFLSSWICSILIVSMLICQLTTLYLYTKNSKKYYKEMKEFKDMASDDKKYKQYMRVRKLERILEQS